MDKLILNEGNIVLNAASEGKLEAIERAGKLLAHNGYVEPDYIEGMRKREEEVTTYIGNGIAIPHGASKYAQHILKSGIVVLQYPDGVDFGEGNIAYLLIGIAGRNDEHLEILSAIALVCQDGKNVNKLRYADSKEEIISILTEGEM